MDEEKLYNKALTYTQKAFAHLAVRVADPNPDPTDIQACEALLGVVKLLQQQSSDKNPTKTEPFDLEEAFTFTSTQSEKVILASYHLHLSGKTSQETKQVNLHIDAAMGQEQTISNATKIFKDLEKGGLMKQVTVSGLHSHKTRKLTALGIEKAKHLLNEASIEITGQSKISRD